MLYFMRALLLSVVIFAGIYPQCVQARIVTAEEENQTKAELEKYYYLRAEIVVKYLFNLPEIFTMDIYHSSVYRGPETFADAFARLEALQTYLNQTKEAVQQAALYFEGTVNGSTAPDSYKQSMLTFYKVADAKAREQTEEVFSTDQEMINLWRRHLELLQENTAILSTEKGTYCFPGHDDVAEEYDAIIDQLEKLTDKKGNILLAMSKDMPGFTQKFKALQKERQSDGKALR